MRPSYNRNLLRAACSTLSCILVWNGMVALAQHLPTPAQQIGIDRDNSRHFGSDPDDPGPIAINLSATLKPQAIETAMRKVADWELAQSQPYFGNIWTWSVLYMGLLAASDATGDARYQNAVMNYGEQQRWQLRSRLPNADDQSLGQAYVELYFKTGKPEMIAPTRAAMDALMQVPDSGSRLPWWWCDALFMAPPLWSRMAKATGEKRYWSYMDREWWRTSDLLYDPQEHLYFRDATYLHKLEPNGKKMFWSRGNGWVMGGLVRVLEFLPADDPDRLLYLRQFQEMAAKVRTLQGKDGLWRAGLLDPDAYVLPENSGSALFTYALAWGINQKILNRKIYRPVVAKAWGGLLAHVYADGRLGCIQQTGAEPAFYKPSASYNYGVGAFLLAASEVDRLAGKKFP